MKEHDLTPHQRIVRNAARGIGVALSAKEVAEMARDHSIFEVAHNDCEDQGIDPLALAMRGFVRKRGKRE